MYISRRKADRPLKYVFFGISLVAFLILYWSLNKTAPAPSDGASLAEATAPEEVTSASEAAPASEAVLPAHAASAAPAPLAALPVPPKPKASVVQDAPAQDAPVQKNINLSVPFTSQAPLARWSDSRQQDGCEEASVLMAMAWVKGEKNKTASQWETAIIALADWEEENYGEHRDVSVQDAVDWIFKEYFSYDGASVKKIKSSADIVAELEAGNLVLIPANGRLLGNPNFTPPGPEHHFLVVKGYDYAAKKFITNDPGTRVGADYRYSEKTLFGAIRAYPTGYHGSYGEIRKEVIVVTK